MFVVRRPFFFGVVWVGWVGDRTDYCENLCRGMLGDWIGGSEGGLVAGLDTGGFREDIRMWRGMGWDWDNRKMVPVSGEEEVRRCVAR